MLELTGRWLGTGLVGVPHVASLMRATLPAAPL
jgi:hypothetical protein